MVLKDGEEGAQLQPWGDPVCRYGVEKEISTRRGRIREFEGKTESVASQRPRAESVSTGASSCVESVLLKR